MNLNFIKITKRKSKERFLYAVYSKNLLSQRA